MTLPKSPVLTPFAPTAEAPPPSSVDVLIAQRSALTSISRAIEDGLAQLATFWSADELGAFAKIVPEHYQHRRPRWKLGFEPPSFDVWCTILDETPLTPRQYWVFESSGCLRADGLFGGARNVQEFVLTWGKGAGKGYTSAKFLTWVAYCAAWLDGDPAQYFGLAKGSPLVVMNVAPNQDLARNVFFKYARRFLAHDIFRQLDLQLTESRVTMRDEPSVVTLADEARFFRTDENGQRYEFLSLYSRHSNASGLDGHNLLAWVMDEADAFLSTTDRDAAKDVHDILRSSAATRIQRHWVGFVISYPRTEDGFMVNLRKRALADIERRGLQSTYFADLAATWDVRPNIRRENTPTIEEDYMSDPSAAMAKYECFPAAQTDVFFEYEEKIFEAIDKSAAPVALWRPRQSESAGKRYVAVELGNIVPKAGASYFFAADGGLTDDSYALVVGHIESGGAGRWLCPDCDHEMPMMKTYSNFSIHAQNAQVQIENRAENIGQVPVCSFCGTKPPGTLGHRAAAVYFVGGWYQEGAIASPAQVVEIAGEQIIVPRIIEDLIITWTPVKATRREEVNVPVDLVNVEETIKTLIERLNIRRGRVDPWQAAALVQKLDGHNGCDVRAIGFSQAEQFKRASLVKRLLYRNLISLQYHRMPAAGDGWNHDGGSFTHSGPERRNDEWRKLQRRKTKIDHPMKGSKDIYDAESVLIYTAVEFEDSRLTTLWID